MKITKLYSGISLLNNLNGWNDVMVEWYYGDWKLHWAEIDYSKLVKDYKFMTDDEKSMSRYYVNQLFTQDEIELLKDYLARNHQTSVYIREQSLPMETYYIDNVSGKRQFYFAHYQFENSSNSI